MFRENEIGCKDSVKKLNFQKFLNFFWNFYLFFENFPDKI